MSEGFVEVPGATVRGVPAFRCPLPAGWHAEEAPDVLAVLRPRGDNAAVSASVGVVRVARGSTLRELAVRTLAAQRAQHPAVRLDAQRVGRFGDRVTYVRAVTVPGEPDVAQIQAMFLAPTDPDRAVVDAVTVVGECPAASVDTYGPLFVDIVAGFRFAEEP